VIPRKKLDIGWRDIAFGLFACVLTGNRAATQNRLERWWSPHGNALACLSVRSGFDLVLQHLALPRGSEILVSAITIRDMVTIIEHHGLVAVPVDLEPGDCAVRLEALERAVTPDTKAVLIAHLFGNRTNMDGIVEIARQHKLFLFEDCAQAYTADGYRGHPGSDVVMFSFGTIKTATAAGGALLNFRDGGLRETVAGLQHRYPAQKRSGLMCKLLKIAALKALSCRPPYTLFVFLCSTFGLNHDAVISGAVRGFAGGDLMRKLRQQPPAAMLALLERRLHKYKPEMIAPRMRAANALLKLLPAQLSLGANAALHSHWVFPIQSKRPDRLVSHLWKHGFDASRGASSMFAVPAPAGTTAARNAQSMIEHIVYLPVESCASGRELQRLAHLIVQFDTAGDQSM
jgi:perosamine synthetase